MPTPHNCLNYIDSKWVPAQSGATLESLNPADWGELVATFPRSGAADVDLAVSAPRKAYKNWRLVPAPQRAELIYGVGALTWLQIHWTSPDITGQNALLNIYLKE